MGYRDLREWLEQVDKLGELVRVKGVHWDLEAGAVASLFGSKLVLFDEFEGYPAGYRVLASLTRGSLPRFFLTTNWTTEARGSSLTRAWKDRLREFKAVPPRLVKNGPIMENVITGKNVNAFKFPVPRRHEKEGGRYIGTADAVILRDPDTGRINLGTYRLQVHDEKTLGIMASEGKDGRITMDKYRAMGKPCPVVALVGIDPAIFLASTAHITDASELDFVGWLKGEPEEVFQGEYTGLPIPARAEIALEGEIPPDTVRMEGPFAEWVGYSQVHPCPIIEVKAIYHRNDPIHTAALGEGTRKAIRSDSTSGGFTTAALIWDQMEKAGVRGIQGVATYTQKLIAVSIKNLYAGHSRQAGLIASQCHAGAYGGTWIVVVDEDIDASNLQEVLWAVLMRTEPKRAIQLLEYCWASHLTLQDPQYVQRADYAMDGDKATYISKVIIDACKPVEWSPSWHEEVVMKPALKKQMMEKWGHLLEKEQGS